MKVYQVIADFGEYEDAREYTVGIWEDEDIANYEKELYISNVNHLKAKLKPIAIEMDLDYNNLTEEEYFQKYNYDYEGNIRSALYDIENFNFCKVKEIEINKRLVDITEQYKV